MADFLVTPEVMRITLIFGVVFSMIFYERLQLTTGGAIVPAYLALSISRPAAIVVTVLIGFFTYLIIKHVIGKKWILYGRRKFEVEVLIGLALILVSTLIAHFAGKIDPFLFGLAGIGFLIPGIIAHDMGRQRPKQTVLAIAATSTVLLVISWILAGLMSILPGSGVSKPVHLASVIGYPRQLLLLAVALSVMVGMLVFSRLGLRSGGFVTGAYLALISPRWGDLIFTGVVALLVWVIVVYLLMPRLLVFGRRKLAMMILVGGIVGWSLELLMLWLSNGDYIPWRGLTLATIMVPALIANDAQRQGWLKTVWGAGMTSLGTYALVSLASAGVLAVGWIR